MAGKVCPWWIGYLLACPIRRWGHDPAKIVGPYVRPGMTVLEPGPGMGFFTLEMALVVGPSGRVIAVDVQAQMLERLKRRAAKLGIQEWLDARVVPPESMELSAERGKVDFVLAFAVVHEMPSAASFFRQAAEAMKPGGVLLLAEPAGHVKAADFENELKLAAEAGLMLTARPEIWHSQSAVLRKG